MSASKAAKDAGHKSLKSACDKVDIKRSKAYYMYHNNRKLFDAFIRGSL